MRGGGFMKFLLFKNVNVYCVFNDVICLFMQNNTIITQVKINKRNYLYHYGVSNPRSFGPPIQLFI